MLYNTLEELSKKAKEYYQKGWIPSTSGNFSCRDNPNQNQFWITASGLPKQNITPEDFILVQLPDCNVVHSYHENQKPSAETSIHKVIYSLLDNANTILHTHNPKSLKIQPKLTKDKPFALWKLPPIEMVKAFGFWEENPDVYLPVVYNFSEVPKIAATIQNHLPMAQKKYSLVPAVLVENHGPTVWGSDISYAHNYLEALDYFFQICSYYDIRFI